MTTNMAIRKDVFCAIGGFPAAYGIYDEDVDLGLKIRRAGYRIRFVAQAAVYHTYLLRPRPPVTKATEFRAGRNRAMLLVRNYGFSMRLVMFCLTAPWLAVGKAVVKMGRCMVQAVGHLGAYLVGMVMGIIDGLRNPVGKDKEQL
jgi:GT2 family glycosyltransferase